MSATGQVTESHALALVRSLVRKFPYTVSLDREDLMQVGCLAVWKARETFREDLGVPLTWWLRRAIMKDLIAAYQVHHHVYRRSGGGLYGHGSEKRAVVPITEGVHPIGGDFRADVHAKVQIEQLRRSLTIKQNAWIQCALDGLSVSGAARRLGFSINYAWNETNKAIEKLRRVAARNV